MKIRIPLNLQMFAADPPADPPEDKKKGEDDIWKAINELKDALKVKPDSKDPNIQTIPKPEVPKDDKPPLQKEEEKKEEENKPPKSWGQRVADFLL